MLSNLAAGHLYDYSDKYTRADSEPGKDTYEYRLVTANKGTIDKIPSSILCKYAKRQKMTENDWRGIGICMSRGWEHIGYINGSFVFKKLIKYVPQEEKPIKKPSKTRVEITEEPKEPATIELLPVKHVDQTDEEIKETPNKEIVLSCTPTTEDYYARYAYLRCVGNIAFIEYPFTEQSDINNKMHGIVIDWLSEVAQKFRITQDSYSLAGYLYYLILSKCKNIHRTKLQLYGIVALDIASKVEEDHNFTSLADWRYISDNGYSEEEISDTQKTVLRALNCIVMLPSISRFINVFVQEYNVTDPKKTALMHYLGNVAMMYQVFPEYPSYVVAEVCFTMVVNDVDFVPQYYEPYVTCFAELRAVVKSIHTAKHQFVLTRYNLRRKKLGQPPLTENSDELKEIHTNLKVYDTPTRVTHYQALLAEMTSNRNSLSVVVDDNTKYIQGEELGEGSFGHVFEVADGADTYAAKYYKHVKSDFGVEQNTMNELSVLTLCNHPNIIKIKETYIPKEGTEIVIYMDIMESFVTYIKNNTLSIAQIKDFTKQILSGIAYLHKFDILHRDLKPQNILVKNNKMYITDLGASIWAKTNDRSEYSNDVCTTWYSSPENLLGMMYNKTMDIWSIGCILLEMITRNPAFPANSKDEQILMLASYFDVEDVATVGFEMPQLIAKHRQFAYDHILKILENKSKEWNSKPDDLNNVIDLIIRMLAIDPKYRYTAEQALNHVFLASV
jgi:hypothetical protein